jgi:hypothetical protein
MEGICHQGDAVGHPAEKELHQGQDTISDDAHGAV